MEFRLYTSKKRLHRIPIHTPLDGILPICRSRIYSEIAEEGSWQILPGASIDQDVIAGIEASGWICFVNEKYVSNGL